MAVKNITTGIGADKTIMELEQILSKFGAKAILKEYDGESVKAISFYMIEGDRKIPFRLPMSLEKMRKVIMMAVEERKLPSRFLNEPLRTEQARRVGWRIIKDWVHSQLSLLEMDFASPVEIFLPYAYNVFKGKTLYQLFMEEKNKFIEFQGEAKEEDKVED
jgi:hypothetical protein